MTINTDRRIGKRTKQERTADDFRQSITDLDALFERFYNTKIAEGRSQSTLENYRRFYGFFTDYLDKQGIERNINEIEADTIRSYMVWLTESRIRFDGHKYKPDSAKRKGLSAVTVNDYVKILKTMFKYLHDEGLIKRNPIANVKKMRQAHERIETLTVEELKALIKAPEQRRYAEFRDYVIINVLIDTMARIGEVLSIKETDVDFSSNTLHIRGEIAKNRKARIVPIQKRTARLIRELLSETAEFNNPYVFLTNYGAQLNPGHFRKHLRLYAESAGIKKNVKPHILRHTGATLFLEAGGDIRHLQILLGHSDLRMVMRYTHLSNESLIRQHNEYSPLNNVLGAMNKQRKILR